MKIGIVSTFGEAEANGSYSCILEKEFKKQGHDVKRYELTFDVMANASSSIRQYADDIIHKYAQDLKTCDYVSIQYEAGLFGASLDDIIRRVLELLNACKDKCFSVTFHRIELNSPIVPPRIVYEKVKKKGLDRLLCKLKIRPKEYRRIEINPPLSYDMMSRTLLKKIIEKNGLAIVHNKRDELKIKGEFPGIDVVSHPLNYYRPDEIDALRASFDKAAFKSDFGITENDNTVAVGVLGSFHPWKDFKTVINALSLLDEKYHLYIFGGAHKLSYTASPNGLDSIKELQSVIKDLNLTDRVHFKGLLPKDSDLMRAFLFCDYVIMPYLEIGEMASAAMGSALELSKHVFASRNCCFDELKKFSGEAFFQFDMGNYMELADKIKNLPQEKEILENRNNYLKKNNISKTIRIYLQKISL